MRFLLFLLFSLTALGTRASSPLLVIEGGAFGAGQSGAKTNALDQSEEKAAGEGKSWDKWLTRKVDLPSPGVWYLWVKLSSKSQLSSLLRFSLDGKQVLHSARREILVQPGAQGQWHSFSRYPGARIEVNVDKPGVHDLGFELVEGDASVEKILASLFHSAVLKGDALDMEKDPGHGRLGTLAQPWTDGAKDSYVSPAIKASRSFYVDAEKGDDLNSGDAFNKAWRSLARVNLQVLKPGDAILLKRGQSWQESLAPRGRGTETAWITLGAWGVGERPLVNGMSRPGLSLRNQDFFVVQDLRFTSEPDFKQAGLSAMTAPGSARARGLRIFNCESFDNGQKGFDIGGDKGYDGVVIENCRAFANNVDGISVWGESQKSARNIVIRNCTAWSNIGMAGIWISGGENGLIEGCLAYNNACVNIWAFNSINITMRRCEVFRGRPPRDAAGFDIDYGVQASTLEYCYSHDNEGDAVLLMGMGKGLFNGYRLHSSHNVMRYCISEGTAPVDIIETFMHGRVYNNTFVGWGKGSNTVNFGGWPDESDRDTWKGGGWPSDTNFTNNIVIAQAGAALLWVDDFATHQNNVLNNNLYFSDTTHPALFNWGGRRSGPAFWHGDQKSGTYPPKAIASLADFQKESGWDKQSLYADPKVLKAGSGDFGRLPLSSYRLKTESPAWGRGTKVALDEAWLKGRRVFLSDTGAAAYGIPMEPQAVAQDYFGGPIKTGAKEAIGPQQP